MGWSALACNKLQEMSKSVERTAENQPQLTNKCSSNAIQLFFEVVTQDYQNLTILRIHSLKVYQPSEIPVQLHYIPLENSL